MPAKWNLEELTPGRTVEATFFPNPAENTEFRLRATHLDGRRAPKVVLTNDDRVVPRGAVPGPRGDGPQAGP